MTLADLGCYTLAGAAESPRNRLTEVADGERLGLGVGVHLRALYVDLGAEHYHRQRELE